MLYLVTTLACKCYWAVWVELVFAVLTAHYLLWSITRKEEKQELSLSRLKDLPSKSVCLEQTVLLSLRDSADPSAHGVFVR